MNSVVAIELDDNTKIDLVITEMVSVHGYFRSWTSGDNVLELPFNCVWKTNVTALNDTLGIVNQSVAAVNLRHSYRVKLVKCVITNSTPWSGLTKTKTN